MSGIVLAQNAIIMTESITSANMNNNSYLLYDNFIKEENVTITASSESSESAGVLALKDGNTNIKFIGGNSTTIDIDVTFPAAQSFTALAFAGVNLADTAAAYELYVWDLVNLVWIKKHEGSGKKNNSPVMGIFNAYLTTKIRFRFITNGQPLEVGEIGAGRPVNFPSAPEVGFQPAKWASDKKVLSMQTEGNTVASTNALYRTVTEQAKFPQLTDEWMNEYWTPVIEKSAGRSVWFVWNSVIYPHDCIYGLLDTTVKPTYESTFRSSATVRIEGVK